MSDQDIGRKMVEEEELRLFLEAYEHATTEPLCLASRSESPDFVCTRPNGEEVGVELTRVTRSPAEEFVDRVLLRQDQQEPQEALAEVFDLLQRKEVKRARLYDRLATSTILVLQLFDCPLDTLSLFITEDLQRDFVQNGFLEVWLADYTGLDAYGDLELFGLKPVRCWGYYQRPNPGRKPFG